MIYLDYNANSPINLNAINAYNIGCKIGNVSCSTQLAHYGKKMIGELKKLTQEIHGDQYDTILTSGGSESNSTIINHFLYKSLKDRKIPSFICSKNEHPSITEYLIKLQNDKIANIFWINPQWNGKIDVNEIEQEIIKNGDVDCIFMQSVNSETGYIQDILLLQQKFPHIWIHIDNVQGFKKIEYPKNVGNSISVSYHKIGAPLGIGALLIKSQINPLIAGKQNEGLRGGTYNIGSITSATYVIKNYEYGYPEIFKKYFLQLMEKKFLIINYQDFLGKFNQINPLDNLLILFCDGRCVGHTIFMCLIINGNIQCGKLVQEYLFKNNITIGTGSACNNEKQSDIGSMASSNILPNIKKGFLRISYGNEIKKKDFKKLASLLFALN